MLDSAAGQVKRRIEARRKVIESTNELIETVGDFVASDDEAQEPLPLADSLLMQAVLPVTPHGELPGPPAIPKRPVTLPTGNAFYDLAPNVLPSSPALAKIVDDGTKPKKPVFPFKPRKKL